jgi:hypothetical protein
VGITPQLASRSSYLITARGNWRGSSKVNTFPTTIGLLLRYYYIYFILIKSIVALTWEEEITNTKKDVLLEIFTDW